MKIISLVLISSLTIGLSACQTLNSTPKKLNDNQILALLNDKNLKKVENKIEAAGGKLFSTGITGNKEMHIISVDAYLPPTVSEQQRQELEKQLQQIYHYPVKLTRLLLPYMIL